MEVNKELWDQASELETFFQHRLKVAVQNPVQLTPEDLRQFSEDCHRYIAKFGTWMTDVIVRAKQ